MGVVAGAAAPVGVVMGCVGYRCGMMCREVEVDRSRGELDFACMEYPGWRKVGDSVGVPRLSIFPL